MSFSSTIKEELVRIQNENACCIHAELAGILRTGLTLREFNTEKTPVFLTENASVLRFLYSNIKEELADKPEILGEKTTSLKKHILYRLSFHKEINEREKFFQSIGIHMQIPENRIEYDDFPMKNRHCIRAFLRGAFMAAGSVTNPDKSYQMEISFPNQQIATEYTGYMEFFALKPKRITRKAYEIVYMKEGQDIVDFLNVIGAHNALMEMENVRILKDMRNQVNRMVNCETANVEKTVNASVKQVEYIRYLDATVGLENLPVGLKEIARTRLENPEMSLLELGKTLIPTLGKSGVNHRLRKLEKMAVDRMERGRV